MLYHQKCQASTITGYVFTNNNWEEIPKENLKSIIFPNLSALLMQYFSNNYDQKVIPVFIDGSLVFL